MTLYSPRLSKCIEWIPQIAPCFAVHGSQIKVITSPKEFYETLLTKSKNARKRITMASLYLGTGQMEKSLVETIEANVRQNMESLQVRFLLDATRGSRGTFNSRKMLLPLLQYNCQVSLYHTPNLRGILHWVMPERWNEIIGLQHMKVYLFDDSVIISGANLSHDYFTNRQDRYVLVEDCAELADFYDNLIQLVSQFSFQLGQTDQVSIHTDWASHPFEGDFCQFVSEAKIRIENFITLHLKNPAGNRMLEAVELMDGTTLNGTPQPHNSSGDTWIFPLIQMGPMGINQDSQFTSKLFETLPDNYKVRLASGYFNLTEEYVNTIVDKSKCDFEILTAHPQANGFLGARGPAGGVPDAYTRIASQFIDSITKKAQNMRIRLREFRREGWTFHAKGLWVFRPTDTLPFLTLIGSPNFGYRSVYRDLETQIAIVTVNPDLKAHLGAEVDNLYRDSDIVSGETYRQQERYVPFWVRGVVRIVKHYF